MKLILVVEWPHHPDWETTMLEVELDAPFYLIGSEGKYVITERKYDE